ncbi:MAG: hypothetical protein AABY15_01835 [Nanoarchaeota archaeon]
MPEIVDYTEGMGYVHKVCEPPEFWWTFDGVKKKVSEIDHQHLSNIIYFMRFVNPNYPKNIKEGFETELRRRFNGVSLPWKPLKRFKGEYEFLEQNGWLHNNGIKTEIIIDGILVGEVEEAA